MERVVYNGWKEISTVFDWIDMDLMMLNDSMQNHQEKENPLSKSSEKQQKNLEEMPHHLAALENREEEREMRIALQKDLIQQLQDKLVIVQGKVCQCHKHPVAGGHMLEGPSGPIDEEEEGLEYTSEHSYMTPPTAPLELEDIIAQDALQFSTPPIEEQEGVRECCWTRVVEYMDDLVEIADDERSGGLSSSESSSSPGTSLPELEDQENVPPINYENINSIAIPIPPPVGNPPPYVVSGQQAVRTKGIPKSAFHPYHCPLAQLIHCSKATAGRLHDCSSLRRTASMSTSSSSGGYGVVYSGSDGEDQRGSSGGTRGLSAHSTSGGDGDRTREEGSESLSSWSISAHIFHHFYPTLNLPSFVSHAHDLRITKTRHKIVLVQDNKYRLHCTQDGLPQDGLTASSYRLIPDHRTLKGHVVLVDSPLCHQLVDQPMLSDHILDLSRDQS